MVHLHKKIIIIGSGFIVLGFFFLVWSINTWKVVETYEELILRPGVSTRLEMMERLEVLKPQVLSGFATSVILIGVGILVFVRRRWLPLFLIIAFVGLQFPQVRSDSTMVSPTVSICRISVSRYINVEANVTIAVEEQTVRSGFVAFLLSICNPDTLEFVEVGYWVNGPDFPKFYSSSYIGGILEFKDLGVAAIGSAHTFSVINPGSFYVEPYAAVLLDGIVVNEVYFTDISNLVFDIQAESVDNGIKNDMDNSFVEPTRKYWFWDAEGWKYFIAPWSIAFAVIHADPPYAWIEMTVIHSFDLLLARVYGKTSTPSPSFGAGGYYTVLGFDF